MDTLLELKRNLVLMKSELATIRCELKFRRFMRALAKANFNEHQPRDELGRWTSEGGVEVSTSSGFLTGIQSIDEISETLSKTLVRVMEGINFLPEMSPQTYGRLVHEAFALSVKLQRLPGVGDIERTFSLEDSDPSYGASGRIRTDVVLRNVAGEIVAIYDVKTGDRKISVSRANELRAKTRAAPNTPVFELNVVRGPSRKFRDTARKPVLASYSRPHFSRRVF